MSISVLIVDDEPDVEALFRQQFRRDLRAQRFVMDFAASASEALARVASTVEQPPISNTVGHQYARHDRSRNAAQDEGDAA